MYSDWSCIRLPINCSRLIPSSSSDRFSWSPSVSLMKVCRSRSVWVVAAEILLDRMGETVWVVTVGERLSAWTSRLLTVVFPNIVVSNSGQTVVWSSRWRAIAHTSLYLPVEYKIRQYCRKLSHSPMNVELCSRIASRFCWRSINPVADSSSNRYWTVCPSDCRSTT